MGTLTAGGLQVRDVITAVDGKQLMDDSSLPEALDGHKPGDNIALTVQRGNQTLTLRATLGG